MTSPRIRRLAADYEAIRSLCRESSILDVSCSGDPPSTYLLKFSGRGLMFEPGKGIREQKEHSVRVRLGSNYPRQIPELHWLTPIYHPNISANGLVCLGGYTTNWVPSLKLDDLCSMLWDMIRYRNFDPGSPYNRMAAEWARSQREFILPLDNRPLRDRPITQSNSPSPDPKILSTDLLEQDADWAAKVGKLSGREVVGVEGVEVVASHRPTESTPVPNAPLASSVFDAAGDRAAGDRDHLDKSHGQQSSPATANKPEDDNPDILFIS